MVTLTLVAPCLISDFSDILFGTNFCSCLVILCVFELSCLQTGKQKYSIAVIMKIQNDNLIILCILGIL